MATGFTSENLQYSSTDDTNESEHYLYNLEDFALSNHISHLISRQHALSCLIKTPDLSTSKKEFEKFLDFVDEYPEPGKFELANLVYPLFVNLYLTLLLTFGILDAHRFYDTFIHIFDSAEGYKDILIELHKLENIDQVNKHPYFKNFREKKYIAHSSIDILKVLKSFLKSIKSEALLEIFNLYFYYEDPQMVAFAEDDEISPKGKVKKKAKKQYNKVHQPSVFTASGTKLLLNDGSEESDSVQRIANANRSGAPNDSADEIAEKYPIFSQIIIGCTEFDISTMDFNKEETELCAVLQGSKVFVHPMKKFTSIGIRKENICVENEEQEETGIKTLNGNQEELVTELITSNDIKEINFPDIVLALKYIPNESHLLLVSCGAKVMLLNTTTGKFKSFDIEHRSSIYDIDINATGLLFCTASHDTICCLWNFDKSAVINRYFGHKNAVTTVQFHPNEIYLVTGSADSTVRLWSIESRLPLRCFSDRDNNEIDTVACSYDGKMIASVDSNGIIKLWDINDSNYICDVHMHSDNNKHHSKITSLSFHHDNFLGICEKEGLVKIWDIRHMKFVFTQKSKNIPMLIKCNKYGLWNIVFQKKETL